MTALSTAGCSDVLPASGSSDTDSSGEVTVENGTSSAVEIAVRLTDRGSETLFDHVFTLGPETIVSHGPFAATPWKIHAFTPDDVSHTWRYEPELPADFECEPKNIGLTLHDDDTIEPWYDC